MRSDVKMLSMVYTFYIDVPHIATPSEPVVLSVVVRVTCGQSIIIPSSSNLEILILSCSIFNITDIPSTEVYKNGISIGSDFSRLIRNPDYGDFGVYTFVVSTKCGSAIARSTILREG